MKTRVKPNRKGPTVAGKTMPGKINNLIRNLRRHPKTTVYYIIWKPVQAVQLVKVK